MSSGVVMGLWGWWMDDGVKTPPHKDGGELLGERRRGGKKNDGMETPPHKDGGERKGGGWGKGRRGFLYLSPDSTAYTR